MQLCVSILSSISSNKEKKQMDIDLTPYTLHIQSFKFRPFVGPERLPAEKTVLYRPLC